MSVEVDVNISRLANSRNRMRPTASLMNPILTDPIHTTNLSHMLGSLLQKLRVWLCTVCVLSYAELLYFPPSNFHNHWFDNSGSANHILRSGRWAGLTRGGHNEHVDRQLQSTWYKSTIPFCGQLRSWVGLTTVVRPATLTWFMLKVVLHYVVLENKF